MPETWLRKLAARHKVSMNTVERFWEECQRGLAKRRGVGYGLVVDCVKKKLRAYLAERRKMRRK